MTMIDLTIPMLCLLNVVTIILLIVTNLLRDRSEKGHEAWLRAWYKDVGKITLSAIEQRDLAEKGCRDVIRVVYGWLRSYSNDKDTLVDAIDAVTREIEASVIVEKQIYMSNMDEKAKGVTK